MGLSINNPQGDEAYKPTSRYCLLEGVFNMSQVVPSLYSTKENDLDLQKKLQDFIPKQPVLPLKFIEWYFGKMTTDEIEALKKEWEANTL